MKTVEVPDDWCEDCKGTGKRALHGMAYSASEIAQWSPEEVESYISGDYDTVCEFCDGDGKVDEDVARDRHVAENELRAEAPHLFL